MIVGVFSGIARTLHTIARQVSGFYAAVAGVESSSRRRRNKTRGVYVLRRDCATEKPASPASTFTFPLGASPLVYTRPEVDS